MKYLIELDKAGAEWVVVAYLSEDANMLSVVQGTDSPHTVTGSLISTAPKEFVEKENKLVGNNTDADEIETLRQTLDIHEDWYLPRSMSIRQAGKKSNHGLNYDMKYKRFSFENEIPETEGRTLVELYHKSYPGIRRTFHKSIQHQLNEGRTLVNCFGRKRRFMDAWGPTLFDAAYSFIPQSTVFDITRIGMVKFFDDTSMDTIEVLTQTHDSNLFQIDITDTQDAAHSIVKIGLDYMNPLCQYNSKEFYIGTSLKVGLDWGSMEECLLSLDVGQTALALDEVMDTINDRAKTR
jgi:hypothetical protein|tara:strand:- start:4064 stop:4945 length:882 start_codon:yes stop_codon:yes gene_type:complete